MKKIITILCLLLIGIGRVSAQSSFNTPVGSPDFEFIERQLDQSNAQYQAKVDKENSNKSGKDPNTFISSNFTRTTWNSIKNDWDETPKKYRNTTIYRLTGGFKIEGDPDNTEFYNIIRKDTATDNPEFSFVKWLCSDSHKNHYQTCLFLDKGRNLLWFMLRYYDKEGYPYLLYQYMITN